MTPPLWIVEYAWIFVLHWTQIVETTEQHADWFVEPTPVKEEESNHVRVEYTSWSLKCAPGIAIS
jgi:hypothetical protein